MNISLTILRIAVFSSSVTFMVGSLLFVFMGRDRVCVLRQDFRTMLDLPLDLQLRKVVASMRRDNTTVSNQTVLCPPGLS